MALRRKGNADPGLDVPAPRPPAVARANGGLLPLAHLLPPPVWWVMAGGGAHGAVQLGSLQAVAETDLPVATVLGTSAGALTGAVVAEDPVAAVNRLTYLWSDLELSDIIGADWASVMSPTNLAKESLADGAGERASLAAVYRARRFDELVLPFAAVATDLDSGQPTLLDEGELIPALLASSAIPGVLPPVQIGGRWFIDGLASANLPASIAARRGAGSLVVFDTGTSASRPTGTSLQQIVPALNSLLAAQQRVSSLTHAAGRIPVVYLPTPAGLGGTLSFADTLANARSAYRLAQSFLIDLADLGVSASTSLPVLAPGLYARPGSLPDHPAVARVLKPVASAKGRGSPRAGCWSSSAGGERR